MLIMKLQFYFITNKMSKLKKKKKKPMVLIKAPYCLYGKSEYQ